MSRGLICDNCGTALAVDKHGEDSNGETAAWISISTTYQSYDACTVSCAEQLLDGPVREASQAAYEAVQQIVQALREEENDITEDGDQS